MVAKLETFLGCLPIETGGKIIGWISLTFGAFMTMFHVALFSTQLNQLAYLSEYKFDEIQKHEGFVLKTQVLMIIGFIGTVAACITVYAAAQLIDGCDKRRSKLMESAIWVFSIGLVFATSLIFINWPYFLAPFFIVYYILMTICSLRSKFKAEEKTKIAAQESIRSVAVSQPVIINNVSNVPNSNDAAVQAIDPNVFECYPRPAPNAPPIYPKF